jgi:Kazal-type serine protease inhibitor-like protein
MRLVGAGLALALLALGGLVDRAAAVGLGQPCGGTAGTGCDAGLYCELMAGGCGNAVAEGKCAVAPQICNMMYLPVCACGGKTYGNDCERRRARAQKAHNGSCGLGGSRAPRAEPDASKNQ